MVSRLAMAYFAGAVAALFASVAFWVLGHAGVNRLIGVRLAPQMDWEWLAPRILWGSLFALGYPLVRKRGFEPVRAGLVLSLVPSFAELFLLLPARGHGLLGLEAGQLTPLVILAVNGFWGWGVSRIMISKGSS